MDWSFGNDFGHVFFVARNGPDYRGWIQMVTTPLEEDVSFWFALPESIHQQLPVELTEGLVPAIVQREHPEIQSVYMAADYQSLESPPALY